MLLSLISRLQSSRGSDLYGGIAGRFDNESGSDGFLRMGAAQEKGGPDPSFLTSLPGLVTMNFLVYVAIVYVMYLSFF